MKDQTEPCDALTVALAAIQNERDPRNISDAGAFADLYFEENPEAFETLNRILERYDASFMRYVRNVERAERNRRNVERTERNRRNVERAECNCRNVERAERNRLGDALRSFNLWEEYPAVAVADYDACIAAGVPFCLTAYYKEKPYAIFREMPANVPAGVMIVTA